jgi:FemAB-related protein (PEP-CTERM system-associated)
VKIVELCDKDKAAWDDYVESSPSGLPQQLSGWRDILSDTYGYETSYLLAKEQEKTVGVLPLFIVNSRLVGCSVASMPGGLCADNAEIAQELIAHAIQIAHQGKMKTLMIQDTRQDWPINLQTTCQHEYRVVDTSKDAKEIWMKLHRETRRQIRIARKNDLTVDIDRSGTLVDEFHDILSRFVHKVGTPVFGKKFLEKVVETFQNKFSIVVVYKEKQPLGAYFQLMKGDTVYGIWGGTLPAYQELRATYLAYWEILSDAANHGYHFWDMGRNPVNANTSKFKSQWGGVAKPIYQQIAVNGGQRHEDSIVSRVHSDAKFQIFMRVWPKLPFPLVQFLGPLLRRHVPFA